MQLHMHTERDKSQLNVWAALACLASTNGTETDNGHREAMQLHTHRRNKQVSTQCIGQQANKPWPVLLLPITERQTMATGEAMQPPTHTERKRQVSTHCLYIQRQAMARGDAMQLPLFGLEGRPAKHRGLVAPATFPHPLPKAHASWPRQTFRQTSWQLWLPFPQVTSLIVYVCFVQVVILVLMKFLCRCNKVMSIGTFE